MKSLQRIFRALPPLLRFFLISMTGIFLTVCYGFAFQVDSEEAFLVLLLLFIITGAMLAVILGIGWFLASQNNQVKELYKDEQG